MQVCSPGGRVRVEGVRIVGGEKVCLPKRTAKRDRTGGNWFWRERMMSRERKGNVWQFSKTWQAG